jgi:hypothetical protein
MIYWRRLGVCSGAPDGDSLSKLINFIGLAAAPQRVGEDDAKRLSLFDSLHYMR